MEKLTPIKEEKNGLDLFVKPHNYRYVNVERLLNSYYERNGVRRD